MKVKVRVAPSPTGNLHIGTAQSALFNWLFAKRYGGEFLLRIEDTDTERSKKEFEEWIINGLKWLGIKWDNEKIPRSTDNVAAYRKNLELLIESGKAFWCHHTMEELEQERQDQQKGKELPRHVCAHKHTDQGKTEGGIIRLAVNENSTRKIVFDDMIRGPVEFEERLLGDLGIARNLDSALYHMAVVCDDIEMEITHVIRGEDHLSNTPKHILIYEALDKPVPKFAHLPLLLGTDRSKLSKRNGTTSITEYQKDYLPEALVNFIGSLNFTYSKEILTKEEMAKEFEIEKVHKSGAVVDIKKLNWINAQYVRQLSPDALRKVTGQSDIPDTAIPMVTERLEKLSDAQDYNYFWEEPAYEASLLIWKKADQDQTLASLNKLKEVFTVIDQIESEEVRTALDKLGKESGDRGLVYWPLRVALSGKDKSPDPIDIAIVLGKQKILSRIDKAIELLT